MSREEELRIIDEQNRELQYLRSIIRVITSYSNVQEL
jgi:hypothetical protein